jgi:hypothetical protein
MRKLPWRPGALEKRQKNNIKVKTLKKKFNADLKWIGLKEKLLRPVLQ